MLKQYRSIKRIQKCRLGVFVAVSLVILSVLCYSNVYYVHADPSQDYEEARQHADEIRQKVEELSAEIEKVNLELSISASQVDEARSSLDYLDWKIELTVQEILDIETQLQMDKELFTQIIQAMYVCRTDQSAMTVLMNAETIYDIRNYDVYANALSDYYNDKLETYNDELNEIQKQNDNLNILRAERERELEAYENKLEIFDKQLKTLTEMMHEAQKEAEDAEQFADELKQQMLLMQQRERELLAQQQYDGTNSNVDYTGNGTNYYYVDGYSYSESELLLLAGIIEAEAGSTSYPGMTAVGSVVMNRVTSPNFANSIEGVIYAPKQFTPAETGRLAVILAKGPEQSCINVAREVLDGKRNVPNYYFKAAWYAQEHGIVGINIGGNVFH